MKRYSLGCRFKRPTVLLTGTSLLFAILITSLCVSSAEPNPDPEPDNINSGHHLNSDHTSTPRITPIIKGDRQANVTRAVNPRKAHHKPGVSDQSRRQEVAHSRDCVAKRNEILGRQNTGAQSQGRPATPASASVDYHSIKPKIENLSNPASPDSTTLADNLEGEHVPRCRQDGSYDPVQCHKIGFCWCVNKYGQAIRNSAREGGEPECSQSLYESDSSNKLVVAGISAQRARGLLNHGGSNFVSSTPNGNINFEATEPAPTEHSFDSDDPQQKANRSNTHGPVEALVPNDCSGSRSRAKERAAAQVNDSIWIPDCDSEDKKLYAEQQCLGSKVCWCVNKSTGLPLRNSEQLSGGPMTQNCTEIKRIIGLQAAAVAPKSRSSTNPNLQAHQVAFYQSRGEFCDADKRSEFVIALNNQFRQQISEYLRQNPSSPVPADLSSTNPYLISEAQVSKWTFSIIDLDRDGKVGDREWSKFKNNFKLVDRAAELDNPLKQQKSPHYVLPPLLVVRSQRKCWRDFLEFCGHGDMVDEIGLPLWMSCTDVPPRSSADEQPTNQASISSTENSYAMSRKAAIVRSQKKNPFLGILKPD